jgi:hypothetical protein
VGVILFFALLFGLSKLPKKKFSFAVRVLMGTGAGTVAGLLVWALPEGYTSDLTGWFSLVYTGYIYLFVALLLPMVFLASIHLVIHTPAEKPVSRLTRWKKWVNTLMMAASALIAATLGLYFRIGAFPGTGTQVFTWSVEGETLLDHLSRLLPRGLGSDLIRLNVIALFVFGIYVGIAARRMAAKSEAVQSFETLVDGAFSVGVSVCKTIIAYKPMGAAAIMATLMATYGPKMLWMLLKMLLVLCLGAAVMLLLQTVLCALSGVSPAKFFRCGGGAMVKALKTRSGSECLPDAQAALSEGMGLQKDITDEVAAYAISSGMQGCGALFPATAAVFALGLWGVTMTPGTVAALVLTIVLLSYGITGLPGTATMAEFAAVMGTGATEALPGLGAMIALDPIGDVPRTLINVSGCMANAIIVERRVRT